MRIGMYYMDVYWDRLLNACVYLTACVACVLGLVYWKYILLIHGLFCSSLLNNCGLLLHYISRDSTATNEEKGLFVNQKMIIFRFFRGF
jgi:hypothetical protein